MSHYDTPSEADKLDDLWRQCENFEKKLAPSIFCPWCLKANTPALPQCCGFFKEGIEKRGKHQFESVLKQLKEVRLGRFHSIKCPYCHVRMKALGPDAHPSEWPRPLVSPFCCDMMSDAATAVVERMTLDKLTADKKKIEDAHEKVSLN